MDLFLFLLVVDSFLLLLLVLDASLLSLTELVVDVQLKILLLKPHYQFDVFHSLNIHLSFLLHESNLFRPLIPGVHNFVLEAHALFDHRGVLHFVHLRLIFFLPVSDLLHLLLSVHHNLRPDHLSLLLPVALLLNDLAGGILSGQDLVFVERPRRHLRLLLGWRLCPAPELLELEVLEVLQVGGACQLAV